MNRKLGISMGVAVLAAAGAIAFVPASADSRDDAVYSASGSIVAQVQNARETSQDETWDMTYGAERPATVEETATAAVEDAPIVDFTFG